MDITGLISDSLLNDGVDDFYYRRVLTAVFNSANDRSKRIFFQFVEAAAYAAADTIKIINGVNDILLFGQHDRNVTATDHAHIINRIEICRIVHRYRQTVAVFFQRH